MNTAMTAFLAVLLALALGGCNAIHSDAVRELVKLQGEKIDEAKSNSGQFVTQTKERVRAYKAGVTDLNNALVTTHVRESQYALVMGSNQNVQPKTQLDALAFLYQAGVLYLDTESGLQEAVLRQFEADFRAMEGLSKQIEQSWDALATLNAALAAHAKASAAGSADPQIIRTLIGISGADPALMDAAVAKSQRFNEALKKVGRYAPRDALERPAGYVDELVDLLDRINAK